MAKAKSQSQAQSQAVVPPPVKHSISAFLQFVPLLIGIVCIYMGIWRPVEKEQVLPLFGILCLLWSATARVHGLLRFAVFLAAVASIFKALEAQGNLPDWAKELPIKI